MKQTWLQEARLRITQTTPWFFQQLMKVGIWCTSVGTGLLLLTVVPHIQLPKWVVPVASHLLVAGVVMAASSKFATTTPQDLPNNRPNDIPKHEEIDNTQQ